VQLLEKPLEESQEQMLKVLRKQSMLNPNRR